MEEEEKEREGRKKDEEWELKQLTLDQTARSSSERAIEATAAPRVFS